jgi:neurexin
LLVVQVHYKADSVDLDVISLARNKHPLMNVYGDILFDKCEDLIQSQPVTFTTEKSYIQAPTWYVKKSGILEFQFRTNELNAALMYSVGPEDTSDFFGLEILEGHLFLVLDLGSGAIKVKTRKMPVSDGVMHKVRVHVSSGQVIVNVDQDKTQFKTHGESDQLDLTGPLYVGGLFNDTSRLPHQFWSGRLRYGYVGCMQDLIVNDDRVDMASLASLQSVDSVVKYCRVMETQCDLHPCLHRGLCHEGWNRFKCDCTMTSFTGPTCMEGKIYLHHSLKSLK